MDEPAIPQLLAQLGRHSTHYTLRPLPGSFSNVTEVVEYETTGGETERLVLRRYAPSAHYDQGEKAAREFKTLTLLAAHRLPVPQPLLLDQTGAYLGTPGIVTAFVPGRQTLPPTDATPWLHELATTLARIHALSLTGTEADYLLDANLEVIWFARGEAVPSYMQHHPAGEVIWQAVREGLPHLQPVRPGLVHIDYWTGNLLWENGRITAVLDWEEAAYGDPGYDVAYLRAELALLGGEALADEFLAAYMSVTGRAVPNLALWELAAAVRFIEDPAGMIPEWQQFGPVPCTPAEVQQRFDQFVAQALTRL